MLIQGTPVSGARQPLLSRSRFLVFDAIHITLFSFFLHNLNPMVLLLSGLVSLLLYVLLLYSELMSSQWSVTPLVCFAISSALRIGGSGVFLASIYMCDLHDAVRFVKFDPQEYIMSGHLLLLFGNWCFLSCYFLTEYLLSRTDSEKSPLPQLTSPQFLTIGLLLIGLTWTIRLIGMIGINLSTLGRGPGMIQGYAILVGVFFLLIARHGRTRLESNLIMLLVGAVVAIDVLIGLRGYMKQAVVHALLPVGVYYLQRVKVRRFRVKIGMRRLIPLALLAYFVVMILFPYISTKRSRMYDRRADKSIRGILRETLAAGIPGTEAFRKTHRFPTQGFWTFFTRNEWTSCAAWAVHRVENNGDIGGKTLREGVIAIVPRLAWPDKPRIAHGREFAVVLGQAKSFETATTSTALGLAATFYWNGGPILTMLGMGANGAILAVTWLLVRHRILINPVAGIVYFMLLMESFRTFSGQFDGSLSFYAYIYIVFLPVMLLLQVFLFSDQVVRSNGQRIQ
jgi:hypothetical protein